MGGQKQKVKGRLVAKGFQEKETPQSDSPTMLRESMKMFFLVAANENFELRKIDIRAACRNAALISIFLNSKFSFAATKKNIFIDSLNIVGESDWGVSFS